MAAVSALLFPGVGKVAMEYHLDHIAPKELPLEPKSHMVVLCAVVFSTDLLARNWFYFVAGGA